MKADQTQDAMLPEGKSAIPTGPSLSGLRAVLVGLGTRTHVALARYLVARGADVTITDSKSEAQLGEEIRSLAGFPVRLSLGGHRPEEIMPTDVAFISPGVPREIPFLEELRSRGVRMSSEIELLFEICPVPIVAITGSSGKTTTTTLVGEMLSAGGRPTLVGGNIGIPLVDRLEGLDANSRVVLELSSFQLECMDRSPHIGAILNVTPNHMDRHRTFERYAEAKSNIVLHQGATDVAVLGLDDPVAHSLVDRCPGRVVGFSQNAPVVEGAFRRGSELVCRWESTEEIICEVGQVKLRGQHNLYNVLAAAAVARADGVDMRAITRVATSFCGVEHRLEPVAEIGGVRFVNDSIATSPERALAALRSFDEPIVLIGGGRSKHLPLEDFASEIARRARALVTLGEMGDELEAAVRAQDARGLPVRHGETLIDAVEKAAECAKPGDVVLLSPGGTSFDQFRDFEERGRAFKAAVAELIRRSGG